jgi:hypothetical protein
MGVAVMGESQPLLILPHLSPVARGIREELRAVVVSLFLILVAVAVAVLV